MLTKSQLGSWFEMLYVLHLPISTDTLLFIFAALGAGLFSEAALPRRAGKGNHSSYIFCSMYFHSIIQTQDHFS